MLMKSSKSSAGNACRLQHLPRSQFRSRSNGQQQQHPATIMLSLSDSIQSAATTDTTSGSACATDMTPFRCPSLSAIRHDDEIDGLPHPGCSNGLEDSGSKSCSDDDDDFMRNQNPMTKPDSKTLGQQRKHQHHYRSQGKQLLKSQQRPQHANKKNTESWLVHIPSSGDDNDNDDDQAATVMDNHSAKKCTNTFRQQHIHRQETNSKSEPQLSTTSHPNKKQRRTNCKPVLSDTIASSFLLPPNNDHHSQTHKNKRNNNAANMVVVLEDSDDDFGMSYNPTSSQFGLVSKTRLRGSPAKTRIPVRVQQDKSTWVLQTNQEVVHIHDSSDDDSIKNKAFNCPRSVVSSFNDTHSKHPAINADVSLSNSRLSNNRVLKIDTKQQSDSKPTCPVQSSPHIITPINNHQHDAVRDKVKTQNKPTTQTLPDDITSQNEAYFARLWNEDTSSTAAGRTQKPQVASLRRRVKFSRRPSNKRRSSNTDNQKETKTLAFRVDLSVSCDENKRHAARTKPFATPKMMSKHDSDHDSLLRDDDSFDDEASESDAQSVESFDDARSFDEDDGSSSSSQDDEIQTQQIILPPLTLVDKARMLEGVETMQDKAYQVLLWRMGFRCCLFQHQFIGSRAIAGLPPNFPLQSITIQDPQEITMAKAVYGLHLSETRGLVLADDMGLGKTYQAITGALMLKAVVKAMNQPVLPTLVISPNVALIDQWRKELLTNGVESNRILYIKSRHKIGTNPSFRHDFIFMTRYTLAAETKAMLDNGQALNPEKNASSLFAGVGLAFFAKLWRLKRGSIGKLKDNLRKGGESYDDCCTRIVAQWLRNKNTANNHITPTFGLVVMDEAHFLKNRASFWGIGAVLLGIGAHRTITMTGTPYCNNSSDVASLQSYIDVHDPAAKTLWWDKATSSSSSSSSDMTVIESVKAWRDTYLIRRRKEQVLKHLLPVKTINNIQVQCFPRELYVYEKIEAKLMSLMQQYGKSNHPHHREQEVQDILMALMTLARGSLVHPMIPNGREMTIYFSPSRRHLAKKEISTTSCVYCNALSRPTIPLTTSINDDEEQHQRRSRGPRLDLDLGDDDLLNDDEDVVVIRDKKKLGKLVWVPSEYCHVTKQHQGTIGHVIHEKCLKSFRDELPSTCPRCTDLGNRANMMLLPGSTCTSTTTSSPAATKHERYCRHVRPLPMAVGQGGFVASSKIELVLEQIKKIPKNEKLLILSFFKSVLDLLEGVLVEDMGIKCARYDGDMNQDDRKVELERFKTDESCRVLLSTVHCCGTGLNITEANHVFFVDRWFNPTVHDQAMDRCYRIGQEKDVFVSFFDCLGTIDIGMMLTNKYKQENSAILLADGITDLGGDGTAMSFRQLSGVMRTLLEQLARERKAHVNDWGVDAPFRRVDATVLQDLMAQMADIASQAATSKRRRTNKQRG